MGFHITGAIASLFILMPNLLFFLYPPKEMPSQKQKEPVWLTALENIGRIVCFLYPIAFGTDLFIALKSGNIMVYLMAAFVLAYYALWVRYFVSGRKFALLFRPSFFLPVPMAVFPASYFLALALLLQSAIMISAAIVFAAGHISISLMTYRQLQKDGSTM